MSVCHSIILKFGRCILRTLLVQCRARSDKEACCKTLDKVLPWREQGAPLTSFPLLLGVVCVLVARLSGDLVLLSQVLSCDAHRDLDVQVGKPRPQSVLQLRVMFTHTNKEHQGLLMNDKEQTSKHVWTTSAHNSLEPFSNKPQSSWNIVGEDVGVPISSVLTMWHAYLSIDLCYCPRK